MKQLNNILQNKWTSISLLIILFITMVVFFNFAANASAETMSMQEKLDQKHEELMEAQEEMATISIELSNVEMKAETVEKQLQEELAQKTEELSQKTEEVNSLTEDLDEIKENMFKSKQVYGVVVTESDVELLAKTVWGEARGLNDFEKSMVVWCILNRVDAGGGTIAQVIKAPGQFHGYSSNFPVDKDIAELVRDVLARWQLEKVCSGDVGRTLPADYLWFCAKNGHNVYRNKYSGNYKTWSMNCWNPYE